MNVSARLEPAFAFIHRLHGTRGLALANPALLLLALLQAALPTPLVRALLLVATAVLLLATAMLPREGVAVLQRADKLAHHEAPESLLWRRLAWLAGLVVALLPAIFMPAYGVPHLSPLTGLMQPTTIARLGAAYLFLVLTLATMYVRRSRRVAPELATQRPSRMGARSKPSLQRQAFMVGLAAIGGAWLWMTFHFWRPFGGTLWPPTELFASPSSTAALAFTVTIPLLMFVALAGHFESWWRMRHRRAGWLVLLHAALCVVVVVLHGRNLLWLAALQRAGFL